MTAGVPLEEKQSVCDLCWYLWARSLGKGCPFKSGTIFIEDEHYLLFSALSRLGYSRVLIRGVLPRFFLHSRTKSRVRKSRTRCASAVPISPNSWAPPIVDNQIEFCENKAQWLLPEGETEIVMSRGKIGRGYEQVGMDFAVRETGIVLPFNRRHLLFGRVPLKRYEQASFTFLKFENYGTEQLGDIVRHGIQYGLHVMKRESREKMPSRRETVGKRIFQRFQELVQLIFEFPSLKPIIKHDSMEQVLDRASVKGVSYM